MRIVIAGCGGVGCDLAHELDLAGHIVSVIDTHQEALAALGPDFGGSFHQGDAYDVAVLRASGIEEADAFVAATGSDNANAIAVQVAGRVFAVPTVIALLNDPRREATYRALDVPFIWGPAVTADAIRASIVSRGDQLRTA
jgi:trk system potassium uptake protein TrkA